MSSPDYSDHPDALLIDDTTLTQVVQQVIKDDSATVLNWSIHKLKGIGGGIGGNQVVLISGEAQSKTGVQPWRLVIKTLHPEPDERPDAPHYTLREVEVYASDFTDCLSDALRLPYCYLIERDKPDGSCWLWLEFIEETAEDRWTDEQFLRSARHLGQFNGGYLDPQQSPCKMDYPWFSADWHRDNLDKIAPLISRFRHVMTHPLYQLAYSDDTHAYLLELWAQREHYLKRLAGLPQTICHYDAFRRNLLAQGQDTYAIDWSFVGPGPVGADVAAMLWVSFVFNNVSVAQVDRLYEPLLEAYLTGIREHTSDLDEASIKQGYAASFVIRVLISAGYDTLLILDEHKHAHFESIINLPLERYMRENVAAVQPIIRRIAASLDG